MKPPKKLPFDPKVFFSKVNGGRTISDYHNNQIVYEQSKPADSVFYIQKGKAKGTVVSEQDKEAVVAVLVPVISSARDAWPHRARTKRKAIANIQQSCSDSPAIANPMDGVFGTDTYCAAGELSRFDP
jgi:CRP-like cAMP-binding protein